MQTRQTRTILWSMIIAAPFFVITCLSVNGHAGVEITPRIRGGIEYTDNYFLSNDNPGSEKESEWITSVSPGLGIDITGRALDLSLNYEPSYTMYDKYSDNNYWEHAADVTGTWRVTRHTEASLDYAFLRTEDPIDEEDLTIRRERDPYDRHTAEARIDYFFGAENSLYALGDYSRLDNEDPTMEDSSEYGAGAGIVYWFNINWGLELNIHQTMAEYEESDDFGETVGLIRFSYRSNRSLTGYLQYEHTDHRYDEEIEESDYRIYDGAVGIEYAIDHSMDAIVEVHHFIRDMADGENESHTPVNLTFTKRFTQGSVTLDAEGGYDYTTAAAENLGYYIYYGGSLEADYNFTRHISGDLAIGYTYNDYTDEIPEREDDVYRAGCGLSFQLSSWVTTRFEYAFNAIESNIEDNDYRENRGAFFITIAPPQPYRF